MENQKHDSLFLGQNGSNSKGEYGLVSSAEADLSDEGLPMKKSLEALEIGDEEGCGMQGDESQVNPWQRTLFTPLFPDNRIQCLGVQLMESVEGVRLFKFVIVSWVGLIGMFYFVRWMVSGGGGLWSLRTFPSRMARSFFPFGMVGF